MSNQSREENRWTRAIENAMFGVWDLDPRLDLVHYSPQWKERLGFPRIHASDNSAVWRCRVHPDDFNPMVRSLQSHFAGDSRTYEMQFRLRSNGSGYRTVVSRGRVVARDDSGNATRIIGTMVDLTGRPASAANYGLVDDKSGRADKVARSPFHAILGVTHPLAEIDPQSETSETPATARAQERGQLVELIHDLLDVALRQASGTRG